MTGFEIYDLLEQHEILGESFELEFKSAKGGMPKSLWESYSAFANSEGGSIVLGISEKEDVIKIDGLSKQEVQKYQTDFWNLVNSKSKVNINILSEHHVEVVELKDGAFILAIIVPPAEYRTKPVYLGSDPLRGTYKRNNTGDYLCTPDEVRQMIADALPAKADARILEKFTLDDIDLESLSQFRQVFRSAKPSHPFLKEGDQGLLEKIGGWRKDRHTQKDGLTAAGLLMFGKHLSIIEAFPEFHLDYQEIFDTNNRWSDRVFPDGTWEANIFQFYFKIWPKLSSSLPISFKLQDGQRKDEDTLHEALREALVNSLVHADYSIPGGVVIKKFSDNFIFANPGNLLITTDQYYRGGLSVPRNNSIQTMFVLLGYGEKAGSGSTRILSAWEGYHWRKPDIKVNSQPSRVELHLRMESLLPQKSIDNLTKLFGTEIRQMYGDGLVALATAEIEGSITNTRLQRFMSAHSSEISKLLINLCTMGYLVSSGKGRGTIYHLNSDFNASNSLFATNLHGVEPNVASSEPNVASSESNVASSGSNIASSEPNVASFEPKRMPYDKMCALILNSCKDRFLSLEEIAIEVNRNTNYLKNNLIPKLVLSGVLERLYPDIKTHPNQKYRTATNKH